ncbi:MAG: vWA domain-containing protein [Planctomycetota bacterium]
MSQPTQCLMRIARASMVLTVLCGMVAMSMSAMASENILLATEQADQPKLVLDAKPAYSILRAGEKQTAWMRVGLTGFKLVSKEERAPLNVAIVLDRSGSMQGEKMEQARNAAISALELLKSNDIISVIAYDTEVSVLVPATKLTDKEAIISVIRNIEASGNTALFGGVSKGAAEVRKFMDEKHVNRIILLSDGLANVGPSAPGELGSLGNSLKKENITVSTLGLGLGYNEDLMVQLAGQSGGNHLFIEDATELADVFRKEFHDALSVVAQEIDIRIGIPEGIRPVRVLGNAADINGQSVVTRLTQIYSEQQKHVVVEVEIPAAMAVEAVESADQKPLMLASVDVSYRNMASQQQEQLTGSVAVTFSSSGDKVQASRDKSVMADVVALIASEQNKLATTYLDAGDLENCRRTLKENVDFLNANYLSLGKEVLKEHADLNTVQLKQLEGVDSKMAPAAGVARKLGRAYQNAADQQSAPAKPSGK